MYVSSISHWIVTMALVHIYIPNSGYSEMIFRVLQQVALVVFDAKIILPPVRWSIFQAYIELTVGLWFWCGGDRFSWWLVMGFHISSTNNNYSVYVYSSVFFSLLVFLIKFKLATCCLYSTPNTFNAIYQPQLRMFLIKKSKLTTHTEGNCTYTY